MLCFFFTKNTIIKSKPQLAGGGGQTGGSLPASQSRRIFSTWGRRRLQVDWKFNLKKGLESLPFIIIIIIIITRQKPALISEKNTKVTDIHFIIIYVIIFTIIIIIIDFTREVVTCDREPGTGSLRLGPLKCPGGLFFDIERQTWENLRWRKSSKTFDSSLTCRCDWLANVNNCDVLSLPRRVKPNLQVVSNMPEKRRKKIREPKSKNVFRLLSQYALRASCNVQVGSVSLGGNQSINQELNIFWSIWLQKDQEKNLSGTSFVIAILTVAMEVTKISARSQKILTGFWEEKDIFIW